MGNQASYHSKSRGGDYDEGKESNFNVGGTSSKFTDKKKLIIKPQTQGDAISRILLENKKKTPNDAKNNSTLDPATKNLATFVSGGNIIGPLNDQAGDRSKTEDTCRTIPTVFRWEGGGKEVFISGTFNNWSSRIPMTKSHQNFFLILELPEGEHQYRFAVDGQWKIDKNLPTASNSATTNESSNLGSGLTQNNVLIVRPSDFDVLEALSHDMVNSKTSSTSPAHSGSAAAAYRHRTKSVGAEEYSRINQQRSTTPPIDVSADCTVQTGSSSPFGSYGQLIPDPPSNMDLEESESRKSCPEITPPLIPPLLLQVILNKNTSSHCDPNLLPSPNHVMVNHMYALSIKDGVVVLSCIHRYRKKHVSTVIYKPI